MTNVTDGHNLIYCLAGVFFGFHSIGGFNGCLNMWFVYCLLVMKVLFQFASPSNRRMAFLVVANIPSVAGRSPISVDSSIFYHVRAFWL